MGKRSEFKRKPQDKYHTPEAAVRPLLTYLHGTHRFAELCAGKGRLIEHLTAAGKRCVLATDTHPQRKGIKKRDGLRVTKAQLDRAGAQVLITNPPWTREIMHKLIAHWLEIAGGRRVWCLFDADWMHNKQAVESGLLDKCMYVQTVGRVKWFPRSKYAGKDNVAWYCFSAFHHGGPIFKGRQL